jgi:hypothetical protein
LLKEYGIERFEKCASALANKWFGEVDFNLPDDISLQTIEMFEDYILDSGTYGTSDQAIVQKLNHNASLLAKIKLLFGRVFLSYGQMKELYSALKKYPYYCQ